MPLTTPWTICTSELEYDVLNIFWYLGCFQSCLYSGDYLVSSSNTVIAQSRINLCRDRQPETCSQETRLSVCERVRHAMGLLGTGIGGG